MIVSFQILSDLSSICLHTIRRCLINDTEGAETESIQKRLLCIDKRWNVDIFVRIQYTRRTGQLHVMLCNASFESITETSKRTCIALTTSLHRVQREVILTCFWMRFFIYVMVAVRFLLVLKSLKRTACFPPPPQTVTTFIVVPLTLTSCHRSGTSALSSPLGASGSVPGDIMLHLWWGK
jgi:hypothetical protein